MSHRCPDGSGWYAQPHTCTFNWCKSHIVPYFLIAASGVLQDRRFLSGTWPWGSYACIWVVVFAHRSTPERLNMKVFPIIMLFASASDQVIGYQACRAYLFALVPALQSNGVFGSKSAQKMCGRCIRQNASTQPISRQPVPIEPMHDSFVSYLEPDAMRVCPWV